MKFPNFFSEYRGYRLFGAVAALATNESADRYAYRQGLFVLTLGREGLVTPRNYDTFRPRDFAADDSVGKVTPLALIKIPRATVAAATTSLPA